MPPAAGDIQLFGGAPVAGVDFPAVSGIWLWGFYTPATPLTLKLEVYSYTPPNSVVWGDGAVSEAPAFTKVSGPSAGAPGRWTINHAYAKAQDIDGLVEGPPRARFNCFLGQMPIFDIDKREFMENQEQRYQRARRDSVEVQRQMNLPTTGAK